MARTVGLCHGPHMGFVSVASRLSIDDPPAVQPIRNITPDGSGLQTLAECMSDKGYDYQYDPVAPASPQSEVAEQLRAGVNAGAPPSLEEFHRDVCPDGVDLDVLYP